MTSGVAADGLRKSLSYCVQQVRANDYEHYLCALHLPVGLRTAAFTLRAFNVETSRVLDNAREHNLALMRLMWWQEALDGIYKSRVVDHPIVKALSSIINEHRLSKHWFSRIMDARISDLEVMGAPKTLTEVEQYAESTSSALSYLTLEAAGVRNASADHVASHVGKAEGLALLLRATPYHSVNRRTYIPVEIAAKYGVSQEEIYRGMHSEKMVDVVLEMAKVANAHLRKARELASAVPPAAIPVLLPAVTTGVLLDSLQRVQFNVFNPRLGRGVCGVSPLWMHMKLKWHAFLNTY